MDYQNKLKIDINICVDTHSRMELEFLKRFNTPSPNRYSSIELEKKDFEKCLELIEDYYNDLEVFYTNTFTYNSNDEDEMVDSVVVRSDNSPIKESCYKFYVSNKYKLILSYNHGQLTILSETLIDEVLKKKLSDLYESIINQEKTQIHIIGENQRGFYLTKFEINKKYDDIGIDENYNDDFKEVYESTLEKLDGNSVGLYLFHGHHGSGKTTLIRHLIRKTNKKVIFFSPNMAESLSSPNMIPFLMEHPNSIIVIEDAENILKRRSAGGGQGVSNILNISDGILGDCLNFQIICTFNTSKNDIDPALLRKGRLIESYEFGKLSLDKTNQLLEKLGRPKSDEGMILSDIYNPDDNHYDDNNGNKMGFNRT